MKCRQADELWGAASLKKRKRNMNIGAGLLSIATLLIFIIISIRMLYIQAIGQVDGRVLANMAEEKYTSKRTIPALRGSIVDSEGNILAKEAGSFDIIAILDEEMTENKEQPLHVVDPKKTAQKLAPILKIDVEEMEALLTKNKKQVEFGPKGLHLNASTKNKIEKMRLPGIAFRPSTQRIYPNGDFASHVLGYTEKNIGMSGTEKTQNQYLTEREGEIVRQESRYGYLLPGKTAETTAPRNGSIVQLTLDSKIQYYLESSIERVVKKSSPKKIVAIISDPKTGKILAMSSKPSFDPNKKNITYFNNDAISYAFEPGSTMKIFTVASAIEEGVYNGNEMFQSGSFQIGKERIRDHNKGNGWGKITFDEGVQRSSNVAMALLTRKMGEETFYGYIEKFGLAKKTGIDLPNETGSRINFVSKRDQIATSFGQGSAFTPIQQIQAVSAIANGGNMMKPYIVERIIDPSTAKTLVNNKPQVVGQPISKDTAHKTLDLLESVVSSKNGTGKAFRLDHYQMAGKTGTAQIYEDGRLLHGTGDNIYSFMGLAPANDPKLIIYVAIQQPTLNGTYTGADLLADIINSTTEKSLQHLGVEFDWNEKRNSEKEKELSVQSYVGDISDTVNSALPDGIKVLILGDGDVVTHQSPAAGSKMLTSEMLILKTNGKIEMPDIHGWSLRDTWRLALLLGIEFNYKGNGYVETQSIEPGSAISGKDVLTVKLADPGSRKGG